MLQSVVPIPPFSKNPVTVGKKEFWRGFFLPWVQKFTYSARKTKGVMQTSSRVPSHFSPTFSLSNSSSLYLKNAHICQQKRSIWWARPKPLCQCGAYLSNDVNGGHDSRSPNTLEHYIFSYFSGRAQLFFCGPLTSLTQKTLATIFSPSGQTHFLGLLFFYRYTFWGRLATAVGRHAAGWWVGGFEMEIDWRASQVRGEKMAKRRRREGRKKGAGPWEGRHRQQRRQPA